LTEQSSTESTRTDRYKQIQKVTIVGAVVNTVLAFAKLILGYVGNSQALIADGVHSFADLISDFVVLWAAKHSSKEADEEHPYGHGRIETVVSVLLGFFLIAVAAGIMADAVMSIIEPGLLLQPEVITLVAAFISIVANEGLFRYTITVARQIHSNVLHANAWHHRTDAISSIIALVGIGGTLLGFSFFDAVAAVGVSILIAKVGWDIAWSSLQELIDKGMDPEKVKDIEDVITSVDGVKEVHMLRTRLHGGQAFVDVHIIISNPTISVSEGHHISAIVQHNLMDSFTEISDVTVHIDPEDDELVIPNHGLELREKVLEKLDSYWRDIPASKQIKRITLHYLSGKILVELELPLELATSPGVANRIVQDLTAITAIDNDIKDVKVLFG